MRRRDRADLTRRGALVRSGAVLVGFGVTHTTTGAAVPEASRSDAAVDTVHPAAPDAPRATSDIVAVRLWPAQDYTRVTLESARPLSATHRTHASPDRLSIDIDGLELDDTLRELVGKVRPDDPFIASIRIAQYKSRVVRVVLDLKQAVAPQVFTLKPVAAYQHRLVFDLHPTVEPDPLLALVREKEAAGRQAAASVRDALDELIERIDGPHRARDAHARPTPPSSDGKPAAAAATRPPPREAAPAVAKVERLVIVALDPGHGGEDPGAIGPGGLREKDVVLAVALALRDKLESVPGIRAFLTRDADFFVPLPDRVRKARRVQADLFVSIHADAAERREARGASVFALSDGGATSTTARWLARRENAADAVGGVNVAARVRKDPQAFRAVLEMSTAAQIKDSLRVGHEVLGQLDRVGDLHKPQVEQAGFAVLKAPDIPSILVETAFISNPREEAKLRDPAYRERLVEALHQGIRRYFAKNPPLARHRVL